MKLPSQPGSIPACAGEPPYESETSGFNMVYPPPVRGNPHDDEPGRIYQGSIPACAGEPRYSGHWISANRVYPRLCGGTDHKLQLDTYNGGLSPPVRGNHG